MNTIAKLRTMAAVFLVIVVKGNAQEFKTGLEVITEYEKRQSVESQQSTFDVSSSNSNGKVQHMRVHYTIKNQGNDFYKSYIRFSAPADIKGTVLLTIEQTNREDDQWLYLPAQRKTRRIAAGNIADQFMGTDMTFEDLRNALSEDLKNYTYELLPDEVVDSSLCFKISAVPDLMLNNIQSGYGRRVIYIRKDVYEIIKTEFYDKKGVLFKMYYGTDVRQVAGKDKWRTYKINIESLLTGHKTESIVESYVIDENVEDQLFTSRSLEKGL